MLLGQLFFYLKELDKIKKPITLESITAINLASISEFKKEDFKGLSETQIKRKIRDTFSDFYGNFLKTNKLKWSYTYWQKLTSPKTQKTSNGLVASSEFQTKLLSWEASEFNYQELSDILNLGKLATSQEDVAIYYGLKVMYIFSNLETKDTFGDFGIVAEEQNTNQTLEENPEILVFTEPSHFPLFVNLNCEVEEIPGDVDPKEILDIIQSFIEKSPSIELVLVDKENTGKLIPYLKRHLPANILVTELSFSSLASGGGEDKTFFDKIVKKTLGVRLN